jgi:hypothetical protein
MATYNQLRAVHVIDQMVHAINFPPDDFERPERFLGDLMRDGFIVGANQWHTFVWVWHKDGTHLCADREHLLAALSEPYLALFTCEKGELRECHFAGNAVAMLDDYRCELLGAK